MNYKCLLLSLLFIIGTYSNLFPQSTSVVSINNVIPPSPTAAGLGKYADWPVNLYTGTVGINIPLYTLASKNAAVSISLNYHGSGIRVDDYASWVGLGWSLNSGGVITRTVRGLPDDEPTRGYFDAGRLLQDPDAGYDNISNFTIYHQQAMGELDSQPDVFMFNAMGQSFKFFIDSNYNIQSIPKNAIKIILPSDPKLPFLSNGQWTAQLEDGTMLYFGGQGATERTENFSNYISDNYYSNVGFASSWYLKKIVPASGPEVIFSYESEVYTNTSTLSVTDYQRTGPGSSRGPESNTSQSNFNGIRLSKIETGNQLVRFVPHNIYRSDLVGAYALDSIKIYQLPSQKLVKSLALIYYPTTSSNNRLTLKNVKELSTINSTQINQWDFIYNETQLPARSSLSQDHWGYYNGANNRTLLPPMERYPDLISGDREAHFPYASAGILKQIKYPEGAITQFTYEPNSYEYLTNVGDLQSATATLETTDPATTERTVSFSKNTAGIANLTYRLIRDPNENDPLYVTITITGDNGHEDLKMVSVNGEYNAVLNLQIGNYVMKIRSPDMNNTYCTATVSWQAATESHIVSRMVGGVRIKEILNTDQGQVISKKNYVYSNAYCASPIKNEDYVYSVRTLTIDPCAPPSPGGSTTVESVHEYNTYIARTSYSKTSVGTTGGGPIGYGEVTVLYGEGSSNGSEINTFSNSPEDVLMTVFPFPPVTSFDYKRGLLLNQKIKNASGNVLKEITNTYNYIPNSIQNGYTAAFRLYNHCYDGSSGLNVPERSQIVAGIFSAHSEWIQKTSQTEVEYLNGVSVAKGINYFYDNPLHLQQTRSVTSQSDGKIITSVTTYANDYAPGTGFIDDMKANHQIGLPIEQVSYLQDNGGIRLVSGKISKYLSGGKGLIDRIYTLETDSPVSLNSFKFSNRTTGQLSYGTSLAGYEPDSRYKEKIVYNQYDDQGNPLTIKSLENSIGYHWGYNKQYPIAECKNATASEFYYEGFEDNTNTPNAAAHTGTKYTTNTSVSWQKPNSRKYVISYWYKSGNSWIYKPEQDYNSNTFTLTGGDAYDDIRIAPVDSQIITYTYDPMVGMTSATDPKMQTTYYEYDSINRLKTIKDQNQNIIKAYTYYYRN